MDGLLRRHHTQHQADRETSWGTDRQKPASVSVGQLVRTVEIADTGTATQMANGNVRVDYTDGTSLVVKSSSTDVDFFHPSLAGQGSWHSYNQSNIPQQVKHMLTKMPQIIERLLAGGGGGGKLHSRPASIR